MNQKKTDAKPNPLEARVLELETALETAQTEADDAKTAQLRREIF